MKKNIVLKIVILSVYLVIVYTTGTTGFTQNKNADKNENKKADKQLNKKSDNANWLFSKTFSDVKDVKTNVTSLLKNEVVPQAFDRNFKGEFLFVSQKVPPAQPSKNWQLGRYKTEKQMLKAIEKLSIKGFTPVGMDVQRDGAFIQYIKNGLQVLNVRIIKVGNSKEMLKTIDVYQTLGYFLNGLTSFEDQLWILFIKYQKIDANDFVIRVISDTSENIQKIVEKGLETKNSQISGFTFTNVGRAIIVFTTEK